MTRDFTWRDAGRTVVFRRGAVGGAVEVLREQGVEEFELLSTERALAEARGLSEAATGVHEVAPGQVPAAAAALTGALAPPPQAEEGVRVRPLVALGGGRVIDVAKAIAAISGAEVVAIPTTLSGAPMTAMNALAHGADTLYVPLSNPVSEMTALRGAELIAGALDQGREERDPGALALGSILCGYAIDSAGLGLHHLVCQTLVRICGTPHAETNAAILPTRWRSWRSEPRSRMSGLPPPSAPTEAVCGSGSRSWGDLVRSASSAVTSRSSTRRSRRC